jgi:integrase
MAQPHEIIPSPYQDPNCDPLHALVVLLQRTLECQQTGPTFLDEQASRSILGSSFSKRALPPTQTLGPIVESLLSAKQADGLSERYIETLRSHLRRFAVGLEGPISSIKVTEIERWLRSRDIGPRARNNIRSSIITLFHFAQKEGYLPRGRLTEADQIAKAKDFGGRIGILSPAEFGPVAGRAPDKIQLFLVLGAFAGLRSSEILRLEWMDINFRRQTITVAPEKAKTATRRLVPIQPNLMQWLQPYRTAAGALFATRRDASRAIAFAKGYQIQWPNNALRHSYATYRLAITADAPRVALEMGSSPQKLVRHYRELADEKEAEAWFSIAPIVDGLGVPPRPAED